MNRIVRPSVFLLFGCLLSTGGAVSASDRVELVTGEVLYGKLLRATRHEVSLQLESGGILTFRRSRVAKVKLDPLSPKDRMVPGITDVPEPLEPVSPAEPPPPPIPARADPDVGPPPSVTQDSALLLLDTQRNPVKIDVPEGFVFVRGALPEGVVEMWRDPVRGGRITVHLYERTAGLLEFKRKLTQAAASEFATFRVVRDERLRPDPEAPWVIEIEASMGVEAVHQIQAVVNAGSRYAVVTVRVPGESWPAVSKAIAAAVGSLQLRDGGRGSRGAPAGDALESAGPEDLRRFYEQPAVVLDAGGPLPVPGMLENAGAGFDPE